MKKYIIILSLLMSSVTFCANPAAQPADSKGKKYTLSLTQTRIPSVGLRDKEWKVAITLKNNRTEASITQIYRILYADSPDYCLYLSAHGTDPNNTPHPMFHAIGPDLGEISPHDMSAKSRKKMAKLLTAAKFRFLGLQQASEKYVSRNFFNPFGFSPQFHFNRNDLPDESKKCSVQ